VETAAATAGRLVPQRLLGRQVGVGDHGGLQGQGRRREGQGLRCRQGLRVGALRASGGALDVHPPRRRRCAAGELTSSCAPGSRLVSCGWWGGSWYTQATTELEVMSSPSPR
jgi:hypothetical protein